MKNILFLISVLVLTLIACETKEDNFEPDYGFDYYPMEIGTVRHYQVDSTFFRTDSDPFTTTTQVQEIPINTLLNNNGDTIIRIERSERTDSTTEFLIQDVYSEQVDFTNIYRSEENVRYLKLALPPSINKTWDGNAEIPDDKSVSVAGENIEMFKNWDYRILSIGETEEVNGQTYEDVLTLQLADSDSEIELRSGLEKYARGVGLIYRELRIMDTQCKRCCNAPDGEIPLECTLLPWEDRADEGFILIQQIADY